ncbi:MAG TPA: prepilin-type N-terminal cleavage/methylation domain-containing protein [Dehalococcoidia bacterium]|jgi:prepilin-type N-terminal cleavage/methylation domain-containing protein
MNSQLGLRMTLKFHRKGESGFSLIEVVIALGILALVAVIFLVAMSTSSRATIISQERVTSDSLAKSEMEYIKSLEYDDTSNPLSYSVDPGIDIPAGYAINVSAQRLNPDADGTEDDDGLQQITVTITNNGVTVSTLTGYKVR